MRHTCTDPRPPATQLHGARRRNPCRASRARGPRPALPRVHGGAPSRSPRTGSRASPRRRRAACPDSPIAQATKSSQTASVHRFAASKEPGIDAPMRSAQRANSLSSRPPPDLRDHARPRRGGACQTPRAHNTSTPTGLPLRCFGLWNRIAPRGVAKKNTGGAPGALRGAREQFYPTRMSHWDGLLRSPIKCRKTTSMHRYLSPMPTRLPGTPGQLRQRGPGRQVCQVQQVRQPRNGAICPPGGPGGPKSARRARSVSCPYTVPP